MVVYDIEERTKAKMRSDDRILVLKVIPGKKALSTKGLVDSKLFESGNNLHAVMNPLNSLWSFKYNAGIVPYALKQSFTSFSKLLTYAESYFGRRGFQIVEVQDQYDSQSNSGR